MNSIFQTLIRFVFRHEMIQIFNFKGSLYFTLIRSYNNDSYSYRQGNGMFTTIHYVFDENNSESNIQ